MSDHDPQLCEIEDCPDCMPGQARPPKPAKAYGTCDWGGCDEPSVDHRWADEPEHRAWLEVCAAHREETETRELVARWLHDRVMRERVAWSASPRKIEWDELPAAVRAAWMTDADALLAAASLPTGGGRERSFARALAAAAEVGVREALKRLGGDDADEAVQLAVAKALFKVHDPDGGDWRSLSDTKRVAYIGSAEYVVDQAAEALAGVLSFDGVLPQSELHDVLHASAASSTGDGERGLREALERIDMLVDRDQPENARRGRPVTEVFDEIEAIAKQALVDAHRAARLAATSPSTGGSERGPSSLVIAATETALAREVSLCCTVCGVEYSDVPAGGGCCEFASYATENEIADGRAPRCHGKVERGMPAGAAERIAREVLTASSSSGESGGEMLAEAYTVAREALEHYANGPDQDPDAGLVARQALAHLDAIEPRATAAPPSASDGEGLRERLLDERAELQGQVTVMREAVALHARTLDDRALGHPDHVERDRDSIDNELYNALIRLFPEWWERQVPGLARVRELPAGESAEPGDDDRKRWAMEAQHDRLAGERPGGADKAARRAIVDAQHGGAEPGEAPSEGTRSTETTGAES